MPLPDERKGGSVASILAKFQANVNDSNEAPLIPKARFGQAAPKPQPQSKNDTKPASTYVPPTKPIALPSDAPKPTSPPTPAPAQPQPPATSPPSSPKAKHVPILAPVVTKPSIDIEPENVPGSADKLLGVQVEGLGRPSSPQTESGRLSAPGSPLCNSPPPVSVPFPSTEEPESPTGSSRRLSAVSTFSQGSTASAPSARSGATPQRKHSTAAAPTAASLAKARPRVESTSKSPTRMRASPVLAASPSLSATGSTASSRTSPTSTRSKPTTPKLGVPETPRNRSGSIGSVSSSASGVRGKGAAVPSNGTPRSRAAAAAAAAKEGEAEAARKPRTSTSPQATRSAPSSAKSTPALKATLSKPRTSVDSTASSSPPMTRTSPLASRSAPSSKPGTPSSSGRATPSGKPKTTVAKPFSFGRTRKSDVAGRTPSDTPPTGLGISQSDSEVSVPSSEPPSDAEAAATAEGEGEGHDAEASEDVQAEEGAGEADTPAPKTPTQSVSQEGQADEQPTPRAQRFEASAGGGGSDEPAPSGKVFGGGAGGRPFGRIPIPMKSDSEGGLKPKAADELAELKPEPGVDEPTDGGAGEQAPAGGKVFGGGAGGRPFGRMPIPMEENGEGGVRPKGAEELDALRPEAEVAKGEE